VGPAILYVDDETPNLDLFRRWFDEDFTILTAHSGPEALEVLERSEVAVVVSDQRMQPMEGIELLSKVEARFPEATRMLLTAYSDRELLLAAIQKGRVHDYILKPWQAEDLGLRLRQGISCYVRRHSLARAAAERDLLRADLRQVAGFGEMVGFDGGLRALNGQLDRVAPTNSTVLIRGESGTGKEMVAREIHRRSPRSNGAFVRTNCAAFAEGVLESELFGHEAGAFTGARAPRLGRFEQANGGTLFLDEIGDISPGLQVRLLRVLQEREFERVGSNKSIKVDIRIIAATHRDLEEQVQAGCFRQDLYYRLSVVHVLLPPLRGRLEDIDALATHFVRFFSAEFGKTLHLEESALAALRAYDWPGNVRELRNVIERAAVLADGTASIDAEELTFDPRPQPVVARTSGSVFDEIERTEAQAINDALRRAKGSRAGAARLLGLPRTTLNDRLKKYGIR
jgi:DNA-binding NtrC family response regulator